MRFFQKSSLETSDVCTKCTPERPRMSQKVSSKGSGGHLICPVCAPHWSFGPESVFDDF